MAYSLLVEGYGLREVQMADDSFLATKWSGKRRENSFSYVGLNVSFSSVQ